MVTDFRWLGESFPLEGTAIFPSYEGKISLISARCIVNNVYGETLPYSEGKFTLYFSRVINKNQSRAYACGSDISSVYKIPRSKVGELSQFRIKAEKLPKICLHTRANSWRWRLFLVLDFLHGPLWPLNGRVLQYKKMLANNVPHMQLQLEIWLQIWKQFLFSDFASECGSKPFCSLFESKFGSEKFWFKCSGSILTGREMLW